VSRREDQTWKIIGALVIEGSILAALMIMVM